MSPLLSICIPTYNRAEFLKVMLEALLPQVSAAYNEVEVWVLDNASSDNTKTVVELSRQYGPVNYHCNECNLGPLINLIKGPTTLATGEFVWVLGDHNLMRSGALRRVLDALKAGSALSIFYANFRCASYPSQWPESAFGGHEGSYSYIGNPETDDRLVSQWQQVIQGGTSAYCTQVYAHIVRREIWQNFWKGNLPGRAYISARTTYPHTAMIAETLWSSQSLYIGDPLLTIFNGAQSWGDLGVRSSVYLRGFPGLIKLFQGQGWAQRELATAKRWAKQQLGETLDSRFACPDEHHLKVFLQSLLAASSFPFLLPVVWNSFIRSDCCVLARFLARNVDRSDRFFTYLFRDCRPARWIRRSRL